MSVQVVAQKFQRVKFQVEAGVYLQLKDAKLSVGGKKVVFVDVIPGLNSLSLESGIPLGELEKQVLEASIDLVREHLKVDRNALEVVWEFTTSSHVVISVPD